MDQLIRSLLWGTDRGRLGELSLSVETDGTLKLERCWPGEDLAMPELGQDAVLGGSLMAMSFERCVQGIGSPRSGRLDWVRGNPYASIFLPVAVALSSRADLSFQSNGASLGQSYRDGEPVEPIRRAPGGQEAKLRLDLQLDSRLLGGEVPAYPFKIRASELVCLLPGLQVALQYKGFRPLNFRCQNGMADLLELYVPVEERLHPEPFSFETREGEVGYRCSVFLTRSEMERIKSFASLEETHLGGVHEDLLRRVVQDVVRMHKIDIPVRRQSYDNVASSRMSYFGTSGVIVPFRREAHQGEFMGTIPGLAAAVHVNSAGLEWETNYRARLVGPEMLLENVRPQLHNEFQRWVLEHPEAIHVWAAQWLQQEKRPRRKRPAPLEAPKDPGSE
ncbi:MAG: hypothetical protein HY319_09155 [Armatimonadetes bacterium]|nr:hypothetical protein [Armatimonadota bacterium]